MKRPAQAVHTIVLHGFPDLEALLMLWLIYRFERVRTHLGLVPGMFTYKFIPSGPLRTDDWKAELPAGTPIAARTIEKLGYLFVDCGGGGALLDQHGLAENQNHNIVASIDLLVEVTRLPDTEPYLQALVELVSLHDRTGISVTAASCRARPTPHTSRDLHMLILGLNLCFGALQVVRITMLAFDGLLAALLEVAQAIVEAGGDDRAMRIREMNLLSLDSILHGLSLHATEHPEVDVAKFRAEAERALQATEGEWHCAVRDLERTGQKRVFNAVVTKRDASGTMEPEQITMIVGTSDSQRFGALCRSRGANLVIQFASEAGKFVVSTKGGIDLTTVAAALRAAEMVCRGAIPMDPIDSIDRPGQFRIKNGGEVIWTVYFPEFRTAVGTNFRTNPYLSPSTLSRDEIVTVVTRAFDGLPPGVSPESDRDLPCDWQRAQCPNWCPYRPANLRGCERFRNTHWSVSA